MSTHISLTKKSLRLIISSVMIFSGLYIGIIGYFFYNRLPVYEKVNVRRFAADILKATEREFYLISGESPLQIDNETLKGWFEPYLRVYSGENDLRPSREKIREYLKTTATMINMEPVDAKINFKNSRATEFVPATDGKRLNIPETENNIAMAMIHGENKAELVIDKIEPEITLEKINDLGINEFLGRGESDYGKSPASRIHNIKIGLSKFNGIILKPGEEFSFNSLLGEVDEKDGYQAELVIKSGQLVREYGGGLCQVSTTVFRAAIMSGLKITERKPHSFPVQYYNPQGFDSTIYPGVVDLKFVNDTSGHILIQTKLIGSKLRVEIYGSSDGRKVGMEGPFQYDLRSNGAMKAYFIRKITVADGSVQEERFDSTYKPPPASHLQRNPLE